jgi:hypothetical protein
VPAASTDIADVERRAPDICAELEPRPVKVELIDGTATNQSDRIIIENVDSGALQQLSQGSNAVQAAAPGAYVIISEDTIADTPGTPYKNEHGRLNGRVYRLGPEMAAPAANQRQFELAVGGDMNGPQEDMTGAIAFVVGRGYAAATGANYSGPSMAVQHYENIIPLP